MAIHALPHAGGPDYKRFRSAAGDHILVVPYSRLFDVPPDLATSWDRGETEIDKVVSELAEMVPIEAELSQIPLPDPQSISLNVSSSCNLSCGYCYADRGGFSGKQASRMETETAYRAIDGLFAKATPNAPVTVGFLGGEPLMNRKLVHDAVRYASSTGAAKGLDVRFSITTNGTLVTDEDIAMFRSNRFAVTISVDGDRERHDAQRPDRRGRGSREILVKRLAPLLNEPGLAQVAARMSVRNNGSDLQSQFDSVMKIGFKEAGISPLRKAADDSGFGEGDYASYLSELIGIAAGEVARAEEGKPIRLTNLMIALRQIHRGWAAPFACGAGGGYFSVASDGKWYACHRAIGESDFELGDSSGIDSARRTAFLTERHVHNQTDCQSCWARYLCSGGCHQEASVRTPASCDFVRGWLTFCLQKYCELTAAHSVRTDLT
ncbi:SPASM domain-containing protein (plasmid) [Rhizobium sophoriradicis]|uniref:radical SAM/SPASM domain-containing protein n=1 Tax=Rhizobium sophoriradicis TaxID=1535245 RepID=UPI00160B2B1F|nr:SPASM domain-containing protein [Rhizobium leguminosarum bv. phaseoli]